MDLSQIIEILKAIGVDIPIMLSIAGTITMIIVGLRKVIPDTQESKIPGYVWMVADVVIGGALGYVLKSVISGIAAGVCLAFGIKLISIARDKVIDPIVNKDSQY